MRLIDVLHTLLGISSFRYIFAFSSKEVGCEGEILQLFKHFISPHFVLQTFLKANDLQY